MSLIADPQVWIAFFTLTLLELVLGIDNIVFISILADKLPKHQQRLARRIGLGGAMFMRIGLLFVLAWLIGLTAPWFTLFEKAFSGRDLILLLGGTFLLWKSTKEVHQLMEGDHGAESSKIKATLVAVVAQIIVIDAVFSLDSIITAVGMVEHIEVMVAAIVVSVGLMMVFAGAIARFVSAHPTVKMLALAFLFLIGVVLIADGFGHHIPKGYVYFAMAFALIVELLNLRYKKAKAPPVTLHAPYEPES